MKSKTAMFFNTTIFVTVSLLAWSHYNYNYVVTFYSSTQAHIHPDKHLLFMQIMYAHMYTHIHAHMYLGVTICTKLNFKKVHYTYFCSYRRICPRSPRYPWQTHSNPNPDTSLFDLSYNSLLLGIVWNEIPVLISKVVISRVIQTCPPLLTPYGSHDMHPRISTWSCNISNFLWMRFENQYLFKRASYLS